ncbi:MAG: hypothetical protein NTW75_05935 [Planctomycetales bacterium]|nr:hypothetical protein [Planctomycetales bacterium]
MRTSVYSAPHVLPGDVGSPATIRGDFAMLIDQCWLAEHTQHGAPVLEIDLADAQP